MGFGDFINKITSGIKKAVGTVVDFGKKVFNKGKDAVKWIATKAKDAGSKAIDVGKAAAKKIGNIADKVGNFVEKAADKALEMPDKIFSTINNPFFLVAAGVGGLVALSALSKA